MAALLLLGDMSEAAYGPKREGSEINKSGTMVAQQNIGALPWPVRAGVSGVDMAPPPHPPPEATLVSPVTWAGTSQIAPASCTF